MNPWWLRPPAEENGPAGDKPVKPAKSEESARSAKPAKSEKPARPTRSRKPKAADGQSAKSSPSRSGPSGEHEGEQNGEAGQRRSGRKRSASRRRKSPAKGPSQVALFCDAESVAMAMQSVNVEALDLELVLDRLGKRGQVTHKRAYGDWHRLSELEDDFRSAGMEVIDLPPAEHAGSTNVSIRLALDALELCYAKQSPDTFVLFSAEADLSPLVEKLKGAKKKVLGLGIHDAVLPVLAEVCDEFLFYNELEPSTATTELPNPDEIDEAKAPWYSALVETIDSLGEDGVEVIWGSRLKREMSKRQPELDLASLGFATFSEFLEDADRYQVIRLERDDRSGSYYVAGNPDQ